VITEKLMLLAGASAPLARLYAPIYEKARVVPGDSFNTITSRNGIAMLLAHGSIESMGFSRVREDLTYRVETLKGLVGRDSKGRAFRYFTDEEAEKYGMIKQGKRVVQEANQRMIGNLYYGGRMGNRGTHTDDGWNYRGTTHIQITGLTNTTNWANTLDLTPDQAVEFGKTPEGAVNGLLWYWRNHGLLVPASRGDVVACTKLVQGGSGHLKERTELFEKLLPHV